MLYIKHILSSFFSYFISHSLCVFYFRSTLFLLYLFLFFTPVYLALSHLLQKYCKDLFASLFLQSSFLTVYVAVQSICFSPSLCVYVCLCHKIYMRVLVGE